MTVLQDIQKIAVKKVPNIQPGYTVRVHQKIKEGGKERIQIFEGLVIKMNSGYGADKTMTVRKVVEGIGVEKIFPIYSSNIKKIEVKKKSKIRRSKLYYMRERFGKSARLKESFVSEKEMEESIEELAEEKAQEEQEIQEEPTSESGEEVSQEPQVEKAKEEETADEKTSDSEEKPAEEAAK